MPRPTASASSPVSPPSLLPATFSEFGTRVPGASGEPQDDWRCLGELSGVFITSLGMEE